MAEKRRLGRGLDSLIPPFEEELEPGDAPREVPLRKIELNPHQPRAAIDPDELEGLADSIRSCGVIQPVIVRPAGDLYELVVGERRVRAARLAGLEAVPALVREVPDERMLEFALIENVQRADLNPIEKATAIRRMIRQLGLTQEEAGRRLGLDRSTVANALRLLDLSEDLQAMVSRGTLTAGHARALLALQDADARARLARLAIENGLNVREVERLAAAGGVERRAVQVRRPTPNVVQLEEALSEALGTRAEVKQKRKGGKIVIHFRDHDDFERLFEQITGRPTDAFPERISA